MAAIDLRSVALPGGALNGLVARQTSDSDRGEMLGVPQALTGVVSLIKTLLYSGLSAINVRLPVYTGLP